MQLEHILSTLTSQQPGTQPMPTTDGPPVPGRLPKSIPNPMRPFNGGKRNLRLNGLPQLQQIGQGASGLAQLLGTAQKAKARSGLGKLSYLTGGQQGPSGNDLGEAE